MASECAAAHAEEESALHAAASECGTSAFDVFVEGFHGAPAERNDALLVALAANLSAGLIEMEILFTESDDLADSQAASIKQFENRMVAKREGCGFAGTLGCIWIERVRRGAVEHGRYFALGERLRQDLPACGCFDGDRRIVIDALVEQQVTIEATQTTELAGDRAGVDVIAAQVRHEAADVSVCGCDEQCSAGFKLLGELLEIAGISFAGCGTHPFLHAQVGEILAHRPRVSWLFRRR